MKLKTPITPKKLTWNAGLILSILLISLVRVAGQDRTAEINLDFSVEEGKKLITATVIETFGDSLGTPVPDLDVYFFVERTFKPLPIGDIFNTTDENGQVTIEFPADLPGDTLGNVTIIARIQESDEFKDTEVSKTVDWGVPLVIDDTASERSLWAAGANAPIPLLILVNSLILIVWSIIFYLIYELFKISRM
jgi:hypothetical protein